MKAVVQRVNGCTLSVDGQIVSRIERGLVVYLGVEQGDDVTQAQTLAQKLPAMRIFNDEQGKMNLSLFDVGGELLLVSQFTLMADCRKGNRPSFSLAEAPARANELYEYTVALLRERGVSVKTGCFGAEMRLEQDNIGPVTIILQVDKDGKIV